MGNGGVTSRYTQKMGHLTDLEIETRAENDAFIVCISFDFSFYSMADLFRLSLFFSLALTD